MGPKCQLNVSDTTGKYLMSAEIRNNSWDIKRMGNELDTWIIALSCSIGSWCLTFFQLVLGERLPLQEVNGRKCTTLLNAKGVTHRKKKKKKNCCFFSVWHQMIGCCFYSLVNNATSFTSSMNTYTWYSCMGEEGTCPRFNRLKAILNHRSRHI